MNADIKTIIELVGRQYERLVRERINVDTQSVSSVRDKLAAIKSRIDAVYAHLFSRGCTQSTPTTENLLSTIQQLATRKVEVGNADIDDGECLPPLLCCSAKANRVTTLTDNTSGWTYDKSGELGNLLNCLTAISTITLKCISATATMVDAINGRSIDINMPNCAPFAEGTIILSGNQISVHLDAIEDFQQSSWTTYGNLYVKEIYFPNIKKCQFRLGGHAGYSNDTTQYIYLGCKGEPTDVVRVYNGYNTDSYTHNEMNTSVTDVEIRQGARQLINIVKLIGVTRENLRAHIIDRLADNNDGDTITIYLGSTNIDKLTDEDKAVAFAKNYTLA